MASQPGFKRHLRIHKETNWGVFPNSITQYQPFIGDGYKVAETNEWYAPTTGMFLQHRGPITRFARRVAGDLTAPVSGSLINTLLSWAIDRDATNYDSDSYTGECRDGVSMTRHTGLKVDTCVIEGAGEGGDFTIRLSLVGKAETKQTTFAVPTVTGVITSGYVNEDFFTFQTGNSLEIPAASALATIQAFSINIANNLKQGPPGSDNEIIYLHAGHQIVSGTVDVKYDAVTFPDLKRAGTNTSLEFNFTDGVVTIVLSVYQVVLNEIPIDADTDEQQIQRLTFDSEWDSSNTATIGYSVA